MHLQPGLFASFRATHGPLISKLGLAALLTMVLALALARLAVLGAFPWSAAADAFKDKCLAFRPSDVMANATTTELAFVSAGTNLTLADNDASCNRASQVVGADICRVAMHIPTSGRSGIVYEMWLPSSWNGRLLATGNGGIDGCVKYDDLAYASAHGFAAVGTNNGHNGSSGIQFLNNEDVVVDFAWRSLHTGVETGKKLVKPFYDSATPKSYYMGCSLGGRQGIKAADMFPDDFDGILAGAPAVDFNALYSWRAAFYPTTGAADSPNFIKPETWKTTIHQEVLRQCDTIDGVADGIIEDPSLCHFNPGTLQCGGTAPSDACLSAAQVDIVRKVFSPILWPNGTLLYPGMNPGGEINSADGLYNGKPWAPSLGWFRYAVYNDPSWDPASFSIKDAAVVQDLDPGGIRTWPDSLAGFKERGGKLLVYHGQQDHQITSFNTPRFYEHLSRGMGYSAAQMDDFLRFFRISGMSHCSGGPGAWVLGQGANAAGQAAFDAEHNMLAALVEWVEKGVAPETMTGTKFVNDTASAGVDFRRRHCRWPMRNTYLGNGRDHKDPASWVCR